MINDSSRQSRPMTSAGRRIDLVRAHVAREWDRACREVGFLTVVDHGVPTEVISEMWAQTTAFFDRVRRAGSEARTCARLFLSARDADGAARARHRGSRSTRSAPCR